MKTRGDDDDTGQTAPDHQRSAECGSRNVRRRWAAREIQPPSIVAMSDVASAGITTGNAKAAVRDFRPREDGPPSEPLYTQARPAPPPHATSRAFLLRAQIEPVRDHTARRTHPLNFGALLARLTRPIPSATSETIDVRRLRRRTARRRLSKRRRQCEMLSCSRYTPGHGGDQHPIALPITDTMRRIELTPARTAF